jgi:predicted ATPase/DNA-binding winged helix-turn-helix (wHTH) protein/Flp pilus assembly protein TadD
MRLGLLHAVVDLERRCIEFAEGKPIPLTALEVELLGFLARRGGAVVSRAELLTSVWGYHPDVKTRAVDNAVRRLRKKLEVEPGRPVHLVSAYAGGYRLTQIEVIGGTAPRAALEAPGGVALNGFGEEPTRFFGREREIEQLTERWRAGARLVTIVGPGGVGKTRLARRTAAACVDELGATGAWFVDLSECVVVEDVVSAVARGIGLLGGLVDTGRVGTALSARGVVLVVLDNFEQVVEAGPATLGRWLPECPDVRFVVTSRQRLGLGGENVVELDPLDLTDGVALFLDRARASATAPALAEDRISPADAAAVRDLVRRLDGLPLALELAAARAGLVGPRQMVEMLTHRFELLAAGPRGAPSRQATLRGAIDWSWETLSAWEQEAWMQLGVFHGGFRLDAAAAVLDLKAHPDAPWTLDVISALVDRSLLRSREVPGSGDRRFSMLESIREYAAEKLQGSSSRAAVQERHFEHFADLARSLADRAPGPADRERIQTLDKDLDNLLAAHAWACAGRPEAVAQLALDVDSALVGRDLRIRVRLWQRTVPCARSGDPGRLALALRMRGETSRMRGDLNEAEADLREALDIALQSGDAGIVGQVRCSLGVVEISRGRFDAAERELSAAYEAAVLTGEVRHQYLAQANLGTRAWVVSDLDSAEEHYRASLATTREHGLAAGEGMALGLLANLHLQRGRLDEAAGCFEEAIPVLRAVGDRPSESAARGNLGAVRLEQGRLEEAEALIRSAEEHSRAVGATAGRVAVVGNLALTQFLRGEPRDALLTFQRALRLWTDGGDPRTLAHLRCHRAQVLVSVGALEGAEADLAAAQEVIDGLDDELGARLVQLSRIAVRRARGESVDPTEEDIFSPGPEGETPPGERCADLRLAVLLLHS